MYFPSSSRWISLLSLLTVAQGVVIQRKGDIHIANKDIAPDGFTRSAVLSNGQFPGPAIVANKGENLEINVFNDLTNKNMDVLTTVHWHGLIAKGSIFDDGTSSVTQCPIIPGNSYLYKVNTAGQAGTFWYHSHYAGQYCDGLRGPLVIYDPNDPHKSLYDVDDESTIISLSDWYHTFAPSWHGLQFPESTLINGKGRTVGGKSELSIINVVAGQRYRFRLISMACDVSHNFSIDGHKLTVIEADGVNHDPVVVDSIRFYAGQRYSAVVKADQPVGNYWVRANPNFPGTAGFDGGINSAILRYKGAPVAEPTSKEQTTKKELQETDLHPTENPAAPGKPVQDGADVNINMLLTLDLPNLTFYVNNKTMKFPDVPVMLQILSGQTDARKLLPEGSVYELPRNKTIQLSFPTEDGSVAAPHPYHLHGHAFSVVRSAGSKTYNYKNPVRRDVVNIGVPGDNVTIRFTTDNTGPWIMHCHIALHQEAGLSVVMAEDIKGIQQGQPNSAWNNLCPAYMNFIGKSLSA
ncbi:ferroxidase, multicopper oxidase [Marasmius sp. AFHP31]|nr:ferroxidase, multicopper oxidase [Marasmius sp. AFHP31]